MAQMKKPARLSKFVQRTPSTGTGIKKPMPKIQGAKPGVKKPMPKVTTKPKERMTPQDAAMKKILEGKYGKIYG
jgi:hypothetical protein